MTPSLRSSDLAWALIYAASADARLADDWCDDLAGEVRRRLSCNQSAPEPTGVAAWLDAVPPLSAARFFARA